MYHLQQHIQLYSFVLPDGRKLGVRTCGDPAAPGVLFFHGFGSSKCGVPDCPENANAYIISFDRPGIGDSDLLPGYDMQQIARDAGFILDQLGTSQVSVIGWSAGGLYALAFAYYFPAKVKHVGLVSSAIPLADPAARKVLSGNWKMVRLINKYLPLMSRRFFRNLAQKITKAPEKTLEKSIDQMNTPDRLTASAPEVKAMLLTSTLEAYRHHGQGIYCDARALCRPFPFSLKDITEVTLWHGEKDTVWRVKTARFLHKQLPHSTLQVIPDAGHLLFIRLWSRMLKQFLSLHPEQ